MLISFEGPLKARSTENFGNTIKGSSSLFSTRSLCYIVSVKHQSINQSIIYKPIWCVNCYSYLPNIVYFWYRL